MEAENDDFNQIVSGLEQKYKKMGIKDRNNFMSAKTVKNQG